MQWSHALNPRRIARSLVTVLVVTLIQTVAPVIVDPINSAPKAEAVTATVTPTSNASGSVFTVPTGVFSIAFEVIGGAGGKGGDDVNIGKSGTVAGRVFATFAVTPGDVIGLYPGKAGANGVGGGSGTLGGAGGADTFQDGAFSINGTYFQSLNFAGGAGGNPGTYGASGSGGGAGAASVVTINSEIVIIAGGAGGGGGTGSGANTASDWNGTLSPNGTNFFGTAGTNAPVGTCGGGSNNDGGGGGGGGGGYYGGNGGTSAIVSNECAGTSGSPGGNYLAARATVTTNDRVSYTSEGSAKYTYDAQPLAPCAKTTTTVDIYTVEQVSYVGNCTWTVPSTVNVVDLFLVGGGGGGGGDGGYGGGGGAGLLRTAIVVAPSTNLTLKVGFGGAGGSWAYAWNSLAGDATTVTLPSGTVFSANGGSGGTGGPVSGSGNGGTAGNGGFAGGAGGVSATSGGTVGGTGKTGVTNYFYGSKYEYGGGGGGGVFTNSAATTPAAGTSGGGSGAYAVSSSLNAPGGNGNNGTGGGGGGGAATGSGLKVNGGKGGSGIILIRYATSAANAFPASLASSLSARWIPDGLQMLDSGRKGWIDASGANASVASGNISGTPTISTRGTTDGASSTRSSKSLLTVSGTTTDNITLVDLPNNYTMFHIARYRTSGSKGRLITTSSGNWLSGHYLGYAGATHHNWWLTPEATNVPSNVGWVLSTDQLKTYRADGLDVSVSNITNTNNQSTSAGFGVNNSNYAQKSDFDVADILIFNRLLTNGEMQLMEEYLARVYGLTLAPAGRTSETDTALDMNGGQYLYTQYGYGNVLNDTFTVQAWIKPGSQCGTGGGVRCTIFSREYALRLTIYNGFFGYILHGTNTSWQWNDTTLKIPVNEWHHLTFVKRGIANTNSSIDIYIDGILAFTKQGGPYTTSTSDVTFSGSDVVRQNDDNWTYIGTALDIYDRYYGALDEIKVWKVARTISQIQGDMHSNDATSPLLQNYWDFNKRVASVQENVPNIAYHGVSRADLVSATTIPYVDVKEVTVAAPYTTIRFPRTYINQSGGWKVPDSVTSVALLLVGGGGGGAGAYTAQLTSGGGGGGGGGVFAPASAINLTNNRIIPVVIGAGGVGGPASATQSAAAGATGQTSYFANLSAGGGGAGGYVTSTNANGLNGTSAGGGGGASNYWNAFNAGFGGLSQPTTFAGETWQGFDGGNGAVFVNGSSSTGDAGAGGGASTSATRTTIGGGVQSSLSGTPTAYGRGGSARGVTGYSFASVAPNLGTGGSGQYGSSAPGGNGSAGVAIVRWITAQKPSFTYPTNAYINVGMTETFTTNVAQDSATAMLTRTFRWESTTGGSNGTFTTIKAGTGAPNAAFSWVPTDTSTSGSQFLYRVVVTDSDSFGLSIVDTSTPVFAVINRALLMSGPSVIKKQINIARNETFTISQGTPGYRFSLSPAIAGVTLDTTTAGAVVLRIGDTATVGTYSLTLTVTDSVSASVNLPLSLTISAPPSLTAAGEIVKNGQVLHLDASNRWAIAGVDGVATNGLLWRDMSGNRKDAQTNNAVAVNGTLCKAPTFSSDFGGSFVFNGTDTCYYTEYLGSQFTNAYTLEAWVRPSASSIPAGTQILSQMYNTAGEQISLVMGDLDRGDGKIYVGFYTGNGWRFANFPITPVANTWMHISGTYDGNNLRTYLNGSLLGAGTYSTFGTLNSKGYYIGKRWDGNSFYTGSIAEVRAYSVMLTDTQVAQNFNATRLRFDSSNQNILKPAQKYGQITLESFTVTSGGDTETVTFAVGNRAGISWDTTSTPGQIKLTVQETLTPGTYFDTITVTDNFAQSTNLPIRFTISKADTLTIFVDTPTALNYTGNRALLTPSVRTIGAVGFESGTAMTPTLRFKPAGTTCATGGYCRVGDIGPGGGIVFIDTSTASSDGRIYEVAPQNWSGSDDLSTVATYCSNNNSNIGATQVGIGWGETNTNLAKSSCLGGAVARVTNFNLSNNTGYSDWFIPSKNEAIELAKIPVAAGLLDIGNNWNVGNWGYWASTEVSSSVMWAISHTGPSFNGNGNVAKSEATKNMVRPVRAFKACWAIDTCTALLTTETPTAAGIYVISPTSGAGAASLADRYSSVRYLESRMTINRIAQRAQVIPFVNVNFPDTFTVNVIDGSGNGAVTYTATNGTATGCAFDYKKLYSTTQGTCTVTVVKAGDRNYLPDTTTVGMLLLSFALNQPSAGVGSGPNIALSGITSVTLDPNVAPTISSLSTYTAQAGVTSLVITGAGFDSANLAGITVKFWRNVVASGFTVNAQNTQITVTVPAGATTGKVTVTTPNGQAVSEFALTITP